MAGAASVFEARRRYRRATGSRPHDLTRPATLLDRQVDVAVRSLPDIPHPADAVGQGLFLLDAPPAGRRSA